MTIVLAFLIFCVLVLIWDNIRVRRKLYWSNHNCRKAWAANRELLGVPSFEHKNPWPTERAEQLNEGLRDLCLKEKEISPNVFDLMPVRESDVVHLYLIDQKRMCDIASIFDTKESVIRAHYEHGIRRILRRFKRESEIFDWPFLRTADTLKEPSGS